ncbi:MAG: CDP-alcohol phosphatidyltransferase family protein [Bacteroidota bacterium]|jgi:CDP-diacylglycerol--glycerol-3-phosphate 3-phosphatidyltransferase
MNESRWTISNFLSALRLLLAIPIAILVSSVNPAQRSFAVGLIVIAILSDIFDGMLARKLNQVTEFGKIIDPLADKIGVAIVAVVLAQQGRLPIWFLLLVIVRDMLIFLGGMYVKKVRGIVLQSNLIGKLAVVVVTTFAIVIIVDYPGSDWLKESLLILSSLLLGLSFILYANRFIGLMMLQARPSVRNPQV